MSSIPQEDNPQTIEEITKRKTIEGKKDAKVVGF